MTMPKQSAGLILYRQTPPRPRSPPRPPRRTLLGQEGPRRLVHPQRRVHPTRGQPLASRDPRIQRGNRSHPQPAHSSHLGSIKQSGGKTVTAFACPGDCDPTTLTSNLVRMEWPPRSGRHIEFPEVDRAQLVLPPRSQLSPSTQPRHPSYNPSPRPFTETQETTSNMNPNGIPGNR